MDIRVVGGAARGERAKGTEERGEREIERERERGRRIGDWGQEKMMWWRGLRMMRQRNMNPEHRSHMSDGSLHGSSIT